jgi:superfamily I DNA/RNA helicase
VEFFKKILPVDNGIASRMFSEREEGVDPLFTKFEDEMQEASVVLSRVTNPNESVIVARTNRQLLFIQKRCMARGLRSVILGRKNLWQQPEVAHLLKLAKEKQHTGRPAHEILNELIIQNNLLYIYRSAGNPMERDPTENLNDLTKMAAKKGTIPEFLTWLRKLTYASKSKKTLEQVITLSTVHQMKGRQAKHIFLVGVNQNLLPHKDGEIEEEKRVFFVGATRAADTLEISFYGNRSQFLNSFSSEIKEYGEA